MNNVDWSVFDADDKKAIDQLLEMRMPEHIASAILNMTGAKEVEIAKILADTKPVTDVNENELREKVISEFYKKNPRGPQTPEEEMELQKQLDDEISSFHDKQKKKADVQIENLGAKEEIVTPEIVQPVVELMVGKKPFCTQCASKGVRHLKICPTLIKTNI